jgi:hypothetical protein
LGSHTSLISRSRSKSWVCNSSLAGIAGLNPAEGVNISRPLINVVCFPIEVSATGRSLAQRIPDHCCVSECDREASTIRKPWHTEAVAPWGKALVQ